jgi:2-keto-4-pentenoate hydratase/2-oxohepta-3-ene-1,7-dioic acid hydratase in catechol pathway
MIFDVAHLVWYISQFMTLVPGDIVNTGTPAGVGSGFTPHRFLQAGDVVQPAISGLGYQRHRLRAYDPAAVPR